MDLMRGGRLTGGMVDAFLPTLQRRAYPVVMPAPHTNWTVDMVQELPGQAAVDYSRGGTEMVTRSRLPPCLRVMPLFWIRTESDSPRLLILTAARRHRRCGCRIGLARNHAASAIAFG